MRPALESELHCLDIVPPIMGMNIFSNMNQSGCDEVGLHVPGELCQCHAWASLDFPTAQNCASLTCGCCLFWGVPHGATVGIPCSSVGAES